MKLKFLLPVAIMVCAVEAHAGNVIVRLPEKAQVDTVYVSHVAISELMAGNRRPEMKIDTIAVSSGSFTYTMSEPDATRYDLILNPQEKSVVWYANPDESLFVEVTGVDPLAYTVGGSGLMDGITTLMATLNPIEDQYKEAVMAQPRDMEKVNQIVNDYNIAIENFVKENPGSQASAYALLNYDGDNYDSLYEMLTPEARESMFFEAATQQKEALSERKEMERRLEALASGDIDAPEFSLPSITGGNLALSDLRGKWVIIDFWGSWCPWCIKGFPALKEAYAKYEGKLEILGVDCRDSEQTWRDAVKKYDLPWKNVYNPVKEGGVLEQYAVQGFPTKVLVNPEGKIAEVTVGEDPEFFVKLEKLMSGN